jgi:hypothetical protein
MSDQSVEAHTGRLERLVPFLLVILVLLVAILTITPWPVGAYEDDAIYTVLAKALASGDGYRLINLPGAPHATHYPPVYPFVLALLWRFAPNFPDNIVVFKFANAVFLALAALGAYAFGRARFNISPLPAALLSLAGTLSVVVLLVTGVVLSEPLFMLVLLPSLLVAERSAESGRAGQAFLAGILFGVLALIRTVGAVAVPAAVIVLLTRRRPLSALALAAGATALLLPWQLWVTAYQHEVPEVLSGKYGAYGSWIADAYRQGGVVFARSVIAANAHGIDAMIGYLFMPLRIRWLREIAFVIATGLVFGGLVVAIRRIPVTVAFVVLYTLVVLLWPFEPSRFVFPLWPLLALLVWAPVRATYQWRATTLLPRVARAGAMTLTACVLTGYAVYNARGFRGHWWEGVQRESGKGAKPIVEWVAHNTAMNDVLSTEHDLSVFLYTGRRSVPVSGFLARERISPLTQDEEVSRLRTLLTTYKPRYYITAWENALRAADTLAAARPPLVRRFASMENAFVYEGLQR